MFADGKREWARLSGLRRIKAWSDARLRALTQDPLLRDYEDTVRRLLKGSFQDLSPAVRREKVEQIIGLSAMAAMATASAPIPFLELPVQLAMVRAIAKVNGVEKPGKKVLWELAGALGGGLFFRQVMRMLPFIGPLPYLSRIYGATWALGRVAHIYFDQDGPPGEPERLRTLYERTAAERTREQSERLQRGDLEAQLRYLDDLLARTVISEAEYRKKRDELLALI